MIATVLFARSRNYINLAKFNRSVQWWTGLSMAMRAAQAEMSKLGITIDDTEGSGKDPLDLAAWWYIVCAPSKLGLT